jgi:hypothetical protein
VQLTSSPRRALGLVAVGAIGMSTAVLGVTGTASAATASYTFTTAASGAQKTGLTVLTVEADPTAQCTVDFLLHGAGGGAGVGPSSADPTPGGYVTGKKSASNGDKFDLFAGTVGGAGAGTTAGTAGTNGRGHDGQAGYTDGSTIYGGGGGGASTVTVSGEPGALLSAFGGDGAFAQSGFGAGGYAGNTAGANVLHADGVSGTPSNAGAGVISGTVTCVTKDPVAPGVPTLDGYVAAGDGTAKFWFTPGSAAFDKTEQQVTSSYEYQLDGGAWTAFTPGTTGSDKLTGSLSGLTNMKKYSLALRATTAAAGNSAASAPVTFTPFRHTAAPASVSATVGVTSLRISWTPPADAAGVVDYFAFALPDGAQSSQDMVSCTSTGTSCAVAVKAGLAYSYGVTTRDALGNEGDRIFAETPTAIVPASAIPATLPKADGVLTSSAADGKVVAGTPVTMSGKGFLPGSTVELIAYSTPVKLGEAVVLADGSFSVTVTLPTSLTDGVHNLVGTGVDPDGNVRTLVVEVTVSGGTAVLANTGFSALPVLGAGGLALLAGGGLLVAARRRTAA